MLILLGTFHKDARECVLGMEMGRRGIIPGIDHDFNLGTEGLEGLMPSS